jgi:hypothetical protein
VIFTRFVLLARAPESTASLITGPNTRRLAFPKALGLKGTAPGIRERAVSARRYGHGREAEWDDFQFWALDTSLFHILLLN